MTKRTRIKKLEKQADDLWSEAVKKRDGYKCRKTGRGNPDVVLNAHHIESRRFKSTRWDTDNGITLAQGLHKWWAHAACNTPYLVWLADEIGMKEIKGLRVKAIKTQIVTLDFLERTIAGLKEECK